MKHARERFTREEALLAAGCFLAYMFAYTGRLNMASALPFLSRELQLTDAQSGLFQTVFALVYATGQVINGSIADRADSRKMALCSLGFSALCNLLMGLCRSFPLLLGIWALNGYAQSMLWSPILALISRVYRGRKRTRVSFWMCICFEAGHLLAWAVTGLVSARAHWGISFFVAAGMLTAAFAITWHLMRVPPLPQGDAAHGSARPAAQPAPLRSLLLSAPLLLTLAACALTGFVRDGVTTWAPTLLSRRMDHTGGLQGIISSLLLPFVNLGGVLWGRALMARSQDNPYRVILLQAPVATALALALAFLSSPPVGVYALLLGLMSACMHSVSNMFSVMVPLQYDQTGRVALICGICDASIYVGSSLSGVVGGTLMDHFSANALFISWAAAALAILLTGCARRRRVSARE